MGHRIERPGHLQPGRAAARPRGRSGRGPRLPSSKKLQGTARDTIVSMPGARCSPLGSRFPAGCSSWGCRSSCCSSGWWRERCVTSSSSSSWRCSSPCSSTRSSAALGRVWIPRGLAVAIVYLTFAAVVALTILALATVVVQQTRHASHRIDNYFTVESGRPPRDGRDARPRPLPGLARRAPPEARAGEKQGQKFLDVDRDEGRREVHDEGAELGGGRRARRRRRCSSASCSSSSCRSTCCSTCTRLAARVDRRFPPRPGSTPLIAADGARARELREGPARAVADHRRELGPRPLDPRHARPDAERRQVRAALRRRGPGSPS